MQLISLPYRQIRVYMATVVLLTGLSVMVAWWVGYLPLLNIVPATATMKFNTALSMVLAAMATLAAPEDNHGYVRFYIRNILGSLILMVGGLSLIQYILGINIGIDNLFLQDNVSPRFPGRMSPATAFCFLLIGLGIIGLYFKRKPLVTVNQYILHLVSTIALLSTLAYLMQVPTSGRIFFIRTMAIHTSLCFLLASVSLSLVHKAHGLTYLFLGQFAGSRVMRQLFPLITLLPFVLGYILVVLNKNDLIDETFGLIMFVGLLVLLSASYVAFIASSLNRTDQRQAQLRQALHSSNSTLLRYKEALDSGFIISIADKAGNITHANDNFCEISGYQRHEILGKNHRILNSAYHDKAFFQQMWSTIWQGNMWSGEIRNQAKDGSFYWVYTVIVPFGDETGEVLEYVSIRYNITMQKKLASQVKMQYIQQLETKNQELEQFAYIASHDLQEPLRTVTNFSTVLNQKYSDKLDTRGQKSLEFILKATQRMRLLVSGLLTYSRIGRQQERESVNLHEQILIVMEDMDALLKEKRAQIEVSPLPQVYANTLEVRMLLQNLISNAIKFQPKDQQPTVKIYGEEDELYWKISVSDNGIGIDPEYSDKIFMIFQRLHAQGEYRGNGIGLAHCRKVAEQHGGRIWVNSLVGKGSTFHFTISKQTQYDVLTEESQ